MPRKKTGSAIVESAGGATPAPEPSLDGAPAFDFGLDRGDAETGEPNSAGGFALVADDHGPRGPGRPAGAKNIRDAKLIELMEMRHGSPLDALGRIYSYASDPIQLYLDMRKRAVAAGVEVDLLGMTIKDCLDLVIRAALAALPYHAKKQPMAVEVQSDAQAVVFNIQIGARSIGLTEQRAAAILQGEEIEDGEIVDAIAEYEAEHEPQ